MINPVTNALLQINNNQTYEIQRTVSLTSAAFGKPKYILKSDTPMCIKRKVSNQCVLPILTYGAETLKFTKKNIHKIHLMQ